MGIIINPLKLKQSDLPLIVLSDDRRGFLSWAIKSHTHGNYSHVMEMCDVGYFASQQYTGFKEVPVERYMKKHIFLKFWRIKDLNEVDKERWRNLVEADLNAPWVNRQYDWLGILGHLLGIPKLNFKHFKYCYERIASRIKIVLNIFMPPQGTPKRANEIFKGNKRFEVFGYWFEA